MKANEIINVLNIFKDSRYQRILINGNWGIGKTKYVCDFIKSYDNACYVSLFGKKDINSLFQEIYFRIIETAPKGKIKKYFNVLREKMNTLDVSYFGVSLSIPVIENIHVAINKELGRKDTYLIVFDDLERKHHELNIKEILGMIDSLSKIKNIKTVLIAAKDQLEGEDKDTFENYQEKAIDRSYTIEEFAEEAPINILGEEVWKVIGKLVEDYKFKNLRTFEKTRLFIDEIIGLLGEDIFSDKFTKDDLYRMCFATVLFVMEHRSEMKLLDTKDESGFMNAYYTEDSSGVIEYLCNYILKNSLDNVMSKNVFHQIKNWYETGTYNRENIITLINSINSYKKKPRNFYSSEEEILEIIEYSREYIRNLNGAERIDEILSNLNTAFSWCKVLSVDFGINNEEILNLASNNISNNIDTEKTLNQNVIDLWDLSFESEEARNIVMTINEAVKVEYCNLLIQQIKERYNNGLYSDARYVRQLADSISEIDKLNSENILKSINDNHFFFPIPSGKITEEQWNWCHLIINLIAKINKYWEVKNYFNDFVSHIYSLEITKKDKMLQHRLNNLLGKK